MVMKIVDLYHMESRPMFMDLDTKKLIRDEKAAELRKRIKFDDKGPFLDYKEGVMIPEMGNRIAYGFCYTV